ncbi:hypothetical protein WG904_04580 [Pedobacter sp. Du54]|uniref:hypothetical protein n=1 Tax=Pedobacter anseongensis TaxID=3133439 RepID=UPI0030A1C9FF
MKKILILLVSIIITSITSVSAKNLMAVSMLSVKNNGEINLTLNLGNVTNMSEREIESKIHKFLTRNIPVKSELECSLTLKASVDVGVAEVEIEITVSGPCSEMALKGKKLANDFMKQVKDAVKQAFE